MNACEFPSLQDYLDAQTENLVFMMRDTAERHWNLLGSRMEDASDEEIGSEFHRWWSRQPRRFQFRLWHEQVQEQRDRLKRKLRREPCRRINSEEQLEATEEDLYHAKADLENERKLTGYLKEQRLCRDCNRRLLD